GQYFAARLLARKSRAYWHQDRLRRRRVWRLHRADRRPAHPLLPYLGRDRARTARRHHRVTWDRRPALRRATRLSRETRLAVRLLHAGLHHGLGRSVAKK